MARDFYDIRIARDTLGELATEADGDRYCEAAETEMETELDADVRVRFGDGTQSYTYIGNDNYTTQGPLTEQMIDVLADVYEHTERWVS